MNDKLWYNKPADSWLKGLPVGNGRLAAMVLGGVSEERISLNHEFLFRGKNRDRSNEKNYKHLEEVRELLLQGDYEKGTLLANKYFAGKGGLSPEPGRVNPYQPVGDFIFKLQQSGECNYRRELDLNTATVNVSYDTSDSSVIRQVIAHPVFNMIIIRLAGEINGEFYFTRAEDQECNLVLNGQQNELTMEGHFIENIDFTTKAKFILTEGTIDIMDNNKAVITAAKEVLIYINIGTSVNFNTPEEEISQYDIPKVSWNELYVSHVAEYLKIYNRLKLNIPFETKDIPTDIRLKNAKENKMDVGLPILYFNFGRYLMWSSTIKGELPPNLQGKWNEDLRPAWDCDYHNDINLQMNYWPVENGNLQEASLSLFNYLEKLVPEGKGAAKDLYNCEGILLPLMNDIWSRATSESYGWAVWIGAAAWLSQHFWWHYEYGCDKEFLEKRAYPFIKEVANFYESYIIKDKEGKYQIVPSQSPENKFVNCGELPVSMCVSSSMDVQLAKDALKHVVKAASILEVDADKVKIWKDIIDGLPDFKIGSYGQLLEWQEEFQEVEPYHRHISHLYGLFPGDLLDEQETPEFFKAAEVSLEKRVSSGGGFTGWSRAWIACCYARLGNGEIAFHHLEALIKELATESLLDLIPPHIFQIEGNFGGTAAVLEMLLQSYQEKLHFLPAIPSAWPNGNIRGLRARGGYEINISWSEGKLQCAEIYSRFDKNCFIKYFDKSLKIFDENNNNIGYETQEENIMFKVKKNKRYIIK